MKTTYEKIVEEGMATLLLGLLEKRFGPLSEQVVQQVRAASQEQLEEWAARILTEETLDGVLALD